MGENSMKENIVGRQVKIKNNKSIWIVASVNGDFVVLKPVKEIWGLYATVNHTDILCIIK